MGWIRLAVSFGRSRLITSKWEVEESFGSPLSFLTMFNDNFLDALAVVGFVISVLNYNENLSQSDKDDIIQQFSVKAEDLLKQLEKDLDEQNDMLREILTLLREKG